ncbi:PTHY protein, partial [Amia calva]|nr:PTHY protein [Amia calva]
MFSIRCLDKIAFCALLCVLYYTSQSEGLPLRKRSVSEMQLMHNLGELKHVQERQEWLQMKLKDIHTASLKHSAEKGDRVRNRRLLPQDFPELEELSPDDIEYICNLLEILLKAQ